MMQTAAIPIHGTMIPCPLWPIRSKEFPCLKLDGTSTSILMSGTEHQDIGSTAETNTQGIELTSMPDNAIEVYKKGSTTIAVEIDPIMKKSVKFEWTHELSETPAGEESYQMVSTQGEIDTGALDLPDCDNILGPSMDVACNPV